MFLGNTLHIDRRCLRVLLFLNTEHTEDLHPVTGCDFREVVGHFKHLEQMVKIMFVVDLLICVQMFSQ